MYADYVCRNTTPYCIHTVISCEQMTSNRDATSVIFRSLQDLQITVLGKCWADDQITVSDMIAPRQTSLPCRGTAGFVECFMSMT